MRCLVTGATGFVGQHLVNRLEEPVVIGRDLTRLHKTFNRAEAHQWDHGSLLDPLILNDVDVVVHLAGESVFSGRWNDTKKERILKSRIDPTRYLVESMAQLENPPATFICASAIGFYGDQGDTTLTETAPPGDDFLARVSIAWEKEASKAEKLGIRVIHIRTGIVLGKDGGALKQMLTPFKLGAGGKLGDGSQYMSWIHIDDLVGIMLYSADNDSVQGPVNGVAPEPVTNSEFTRTLASCLHRPAFFNVPGVMLEIALGEFGKVLLSSQRVLPEKITSAGYTFLYPKLRDALQNLVA